MSYNQVNLTNVTSFTELDKLLETKQITGDEYLARTREFKRVSYALDEQGRQTNVREHPGVQPAK